MNLFQLKWRLAPLVVLTGLVLASLLLAGPAAPVAWAQPDDGGPALRADREVQQAEGAGDPATGIYLFLGCLTVFVLAVFVGFEIITKVPPTLHTPLMSGANAISGITLVGAVIAVAFGDMEWQYAWLIVVLGFIAVVLATINVVGGFMVTGRMLAMFKKKR